jgi:hypothetical protein
MPNLYEYFIHKGLELINLKGIFSFIVPNGLGFNKQFILLRKKILESYKIEKLIYNAPFPGITMGTLIFCFSKKEIEKKNYEIAVGEFDKELQYKSCEEYLTNKEYRFSYENGKEISEILTKIFSNKKCKPLVEIADTTSGFGGKSSEITTERKNESQIEIIKGKSIHKFSPIGVSYYFDFKKKNITGRTTDRAKLGVKEKVLLRKTGSSIISTYDDSGIYPEQSLYFIFNNKTNNSLKYFTALINSKIFQFVYINKLVANKHKMPQLKNDDLDIFPVYICDDSDKELHDNVVKFVDELLLLNKKLQTASLSNRVGQLKQRIKYTENKIDDIFYSLYDLTEEEKSIIQS